MQIETRGPKAAAQVLMVALSLSVAALGTGALLAMALASVME